MSQPSPRIASGRVLVGAAVLAAVVVLAYISWRSFRSDSPPPSDLAAAARANARGIGFMEQFNYTEAIIQFEGAARLAPEWSPARINLAIALLNTQAPENLDRSLKILDEVIAEDPVNLHAHFCSGIVLYNRARMPEARKHFEIVTRLDPNDAHAWYWRGQCVPDAYESPEALTCYEKALQLNPYLNAARYAIAQHRMVADDEKRKKQLLAEFETLSHEKAQDLSDLKYTEMGRYGEVIGQSAAAPASFPVLPLFESRSGVAALADRTTWAAEKALADRGVTDRARQVRALFGGGMALLDYNRDGRPDIYLPMAVIRGDGAGDALLRNDGNGAFTDATAEMGLAALPANYAAIVGDYDNDGFPDLALAGPSGLTLLRNAAGKSFENATAAAGLARLATEFLTAAWVDLDQDGDLDLVAARAGTNPGLAVFLNVGVAPAVLPGEPMHPLTTAFKAADGPEPLLVKGDVHGIVASDVDGDLDIDLIVLVSGRPPVTVLNDRMLRFHLGPPVLPLGSTWLGGLTLDANGDEQPDLVLIDPHAPPRILVSTKDKDDGGMTDRFRTGESDAPPLRSAAWCDLDLDGRTDLVGLAVSGKPVFLQGQGDGRFARKAAPFGPAAESIPDLLAVVPLDIDGDCNPDLLTWSASVGLGILRSAGNGNAGIRLTVTGRRMGAAPGDQSKPLRSNADGVGSWVRLHAGPVRTAAENTTLFAGLGQSRLPLHFGIGRADAADVIRIRWPDSVVQAELNKGGCSVTIAELNRKPSSCPILFTWDGGRFAYVTDFLGAGAVGESGPDGSVRPPRPEESVKIEPGLLRPKDGRFRLKIGEPMDEVMYLDRLRLDVIDHPAGTSVFPDERFATSDPQPTQERLYFRDADRILATRATDHRGRDQTATLRDRDGKHVDDFALRSWLGFAEDHFVVLDFGSGLKSIAPGRRTFLVLAGWTDYAFPESIAAAVQAGVPPLWPVIEQRQPDGTWKRLGELGLPAGLTRTITRDVTGLIDPAGGPIRIRTNLQIFWDQIFLAPEAEPAELVVRELPVARATLEQRGFTQEYSPNGKLPIAYAYDRLEPVLVTRWKGRLTRTGDVSELLAATDDRHAVCGPGDEVTADFDAASLPPIRAGWQRSFVLRSWGYCKDAAPTTVTGGTVGPLPYRGMPHYPYDPARTPLPAAVAEYDRTWNTRPAGRP